MEKQFGWSRTIQDRHCESSQDQGGVNCLAHDPAGDIAVAELQNAGEIDPTLVGENVGDIADPDLVVFCVTAQQSRRAGKA